VPISGVRTCVGRAALDRLALVRIKLLLDHRLCPRLLANGLMLGLELDFAGFTDSYDWDILDTFYDPKIALGHDTVSHSLRCSRSPGLNL
jgi:hypothetical protein